MKVAIIGAGFTGLSAAYTLQKEGHEVTVFEKDASPGGLAIGYQEKGWDWTLEKHYHHWFTSDNHVLELAKEINFPVIFKRPKTSVFVQGKSYQLDSPLALLSFPKLPLIDRLRMSAVLAFLRFNPFWRPLEKINAIQFLTKTMGKKAFSLLWEPQLRNKMGKYAEEISLVWFWTRINKRTPSLAYPQGGFLRFAQKLAEIIIQKGGRICYQTETLVLTDDEKVTIEVEHLKGKKMTYEFDRCLVTLPSFLFLKIAPTLPESYQHKLVRLRGLGAANMILRLTKPLMTDGTYWLSICEKNSPVMVVVEHTNLMDRAHYHNEHLVYLGNYLEATNKEFSLSKKDLLKKYDPILRQINPTYAGTIIDYELFRTPFGQPIVPTHYSKLIPPFTTPFPHVFLANIEQVYPWDRGTNYAVELGEKVAKLVSIS
ncbi:MAG TPA: FAD-dependent oxidoreductase [Patescibacteria group bacterium]|nr:FAD-dependent oxidoreductase [Patescibacteria group bacterium]